MKRRNYFEHDFHFSFFPRTPERRKVVSSFHVSLFGENGKWKVVCSQFDCFLCAQAFQYFSSRVLASLLLLICRVTFGKAAKWSATRK